MKNFSLSFVISQGFSQILKTAIMSIVTVLVLAGSLLVLGSVGLFQFNVDENLAAKFRARFEKPLPEEADLWVQG